VSAAPHTAQATARHQADVLVIGGGLAGAWAALGAARAGARVVLVDKGYSGTSGVTATGGPGHWWVPPERRDEVVAQRMVAGQGLGDPQWMHRVLDLTWQHLPTIARHYRFHTDAQGVTHYRAMRGPEYMRALRALVDEAGVTVLDHHPALELLRHADGSVAGAAGVQLLPPQGRWQVRAGAVVLASGGCAFRAKLLGADNNTGDGALMAAELGAELSGMEFSSVYTPTPVFSSMTRSMSYVFADYFDAQGRALHIASSPDNGPLLARQLLKGPVFCTLARMPEDIRAVLHTISPNVLLPFTRRGIDPFRDRFEITLRGEGTVRGIGGLRIANADCETTVPGLFAAGDAATRELAAGAVTGGGNVNSAWALSSGLIAGEAASRRAATTGPRADAPAQAAGQAGLRPRRQAAAVALATVQRPMLDLDLNLFRDGTALARSLGQLGSLWGELADHATAPDAGHVRQVLRQREAAALAANARWCALAALQRTESRGMHRRTDLPQSDPAQAHRLLVGGLDKLWTRPDTGAPAPTRGAPHGATALETTP